MKFEIMVSNNLDNCYVSMCLHSELSISNEQFATKRPAIVICPGGGYEFTSESEDEPVALNYFNAGYQVFVLHYSVKSKAKDFQPLLELAATVAEIRLRSKEFKVDPWKIAVCGFSAGGHLAASLGTLYNDKKFLQICPSLGSVRPDAMILGYPVITSDKWAHEGSIRNVSGSEKGTDEYIYFGLDKHVDSDTPKTFIWHTAQDASVPVENSLKLASALSAAKVPFELHIFPEGEHGMSVCTKEVGCYHPYNGRWVEWSIKWLNKVFEYEV